MAQIKNSVIIHDCGRLLVSSIENAFRKASWTHDVQLLIEKTKPGWLDTTIEMRISWKGEEENVKGFTRCAEDYIERLRRTF